MDDKYKVLVEWDCGEKVLEPIALMRQENPITLAKYVHENKLLSEPCWKDSIITSNPPSALTVTLKRHVCLL